MAILRNKKDNWMYAWYWKVLGVVLMVYVLIGGMLTPLKPGIEDISGTSFVQPGEQAKLTISGYNTHFQTGKDLAVYLKLDTLHYIKSGQVEVTNEVKLSTTFDIPNQKLQSFGVEPMTLIVSNDIDGYAILPSAISIKFNQPDSASQAKSTAGSWLTELPNIHADKSSFGFPYRTILNETIRNTFFHVALWLAMVILLLAGLYHAIRYLMSRNKRDDSLSAAYTTVAIMYGLLGLATGSIWAKYTWGTWWTSDVKLNMAAVAMLIYSAYLILRNSTNDFDKRARTSAAYAIFSFVALIPLIFVIPRMYDSLHPGNGGNPALGGEDLDNTLRLFFYPSIISLILLGIWMATMTYRLGLLEDKKYTQL